MNSKPKLLRLKRKSTLLKPLSIHSLDKEQDGKKVQVKLTIKRRDLWVTHHSLLLSSVIVVHSMLNSENFSPWRNLLKIWNIKISLSYQLSLINWLISSLMMPQLVNGIYKVYQKIVCQFKTVSWLRLLTDIHFLSIHKAKDKHGLWKNTLKKWKKEDPLQV